MSAAICCGICRIAASTSAQVSSAAAYDGVPACWLDETMTPQPRAGVDVDVRIDAALADEPQLRQALEQRRADLGALADQHQRLGVPQPLGQRVDVLDVIVPDRDVVAGQLREAGQRAQRVEVVVEDGDLHRTGSEHAVVVRHFSGISCATSQCSTILPFSSLKMSTMARPRVPGSRTAWTCRIT